MSHMTTVDGLHNSKSLSTNNYHTTLMCLQGERGPTGETGERVRKAVILVLVLLF